MKTYKNITYAVLALSMMIFFAAGQVLAHMEPGDLSGFDRNYTNDVRVSVASDPQVSDPLDFSKGRNAGLESGKETINSCAIGENLGNHKSQDASRDYIAGFDSGFNDSVNLYNYSYCKR